MFRESKGLAESTSIEQPTWVRYRALAWLLTAAALAYLGRNAVGVAESTIREELGLSLLQSGWFMGAFFWTYALLQVPAGLIAHRWGTRLALTGFVLAWSTATLALGVAPGLWLLLIAQLVMGAAQAGAFPASCSSVSHWIPLAQRSLACGILATGMQLGAILSGTLTGQLIEPIGWRWVFIVYSIPGFLWAVGFWLRFRDDPHQHPTVNQSELEIIAGDQTSEDNATEKIEPTPWAAIARSTTMWFLCGQQICRAAGYMFFASWFPTFLQETRGLSVEDSGYLQALVFAGTLTGSLIGGMLTDWIWRRTNSMRISRNGVGATFLMGCAVLILGAWFVQSVALAVTLLTLGAFFAAIAGPCAISATIDIGGDHVPQVFGIMNMVGNFAAASCPILIGMLFDWTANWNVVLVVFAAVYTLGAFCWILVDPGKKI